MKLKAATNRKLRYGGTSVALTALIIAIVIAVNFIFSLMVQRFNLYVDLTPEPHFTLTDEFYALMDGTGEGSAPIEKLEQFRANNKAYNAENGLTPDNPDYRDENVKINLLFCVEEDILKGTEESNYVYQNAKELLERYPDHVTIECKDMRKNPARFTKYLSSNTETIDRESIIIECGSDYRIRSFENFYVYNNGEAFGYDGEKTFASSILAVTRSDHPLACYTVNHGESFPVSSTNDANGNPNVPFLDTLEAAGFITQAIDLSKEEIPENCQIMIVYDPKQDFMTGKDGVSSVNELEKLDRYLEKKRALMVFMNPTSYDGEAGLENLEEFLGDWGLSFRRHEGEPLQIYDSGQSIGNSAAIVAEYANTEAAKGWTESMTSGASKPTVVFPNPVVITNHPSFTRQTKTDSETGETQTVSYNPDAGYSESGRIVYDMFVTSTTAKAYAGDSSVSIVDSTKTDPLTLMALSVETTLESEYSNAIQNSAYVLLCGSTEFGSNACLVSNAYGNSDFLLSAFQMAGREPVPVGLEYKTFADLTMDTITTADATQYTVVLTLVPVIVSLFVGIFVIVRRKNR